MLKNEFDNTYSNDKTLQSELISLLLTAKIQKIKNFFVKYLITISKIKINFRCNENKISYRILGKFYNIM